MADSRIPGVLGRVPFSPDLPPPRSPGVLGWGDAAAPDWLHLALGDTPGPLGLNDAAAAAAAPLAKAPTPASADGPLQVGEGQVTFDAEGNDDPKSIYYSRVVHWPGNDLSGVTLGRGYDMGDRSCAEVQADLAGLGRVDQAPWRAAPQQPRQRRVRVKNQPHAAARCDRRRSRR